MVWDTIYVDEGKFHTWFCEKFGMEWNKACDYLRKERILNEHGKTMVWQSDVKSAIEQPDQQDFSKEALTTFLAFFQDFPEVEKMMIVFDD